MAVAVMQEAVCSVGLKAEPCLVRLGTLQLDSQGRFQSENKLRAIHFNNQAVFSPWCSIGWFDTLMTGKRQQAANCVCQFNIVR